MNQFNGIGRIGSVDSRTTSAGIPVTSFSVALNERCNDKDGKHRREGRLDPCHLLAQAG